MNLDRKVANRRLSVDLSPRVESSGVPGVQLNEILSSPHEESSQEQRAAVKEAIATKRKQRLPHVRAKSLRVSKSDKLRKSMSADGLFNPRKLSGHELAANFPPNAKSVGVKRVHVESTSNSNVTSDGGIVCFNSFSIHFLPFNLILFEDFTANEAEIDA